MNKIAQGRERRARELGLYISKTGATVRETAKKFGVSKSTVHKDVSYCLEELDPLLFERVRDVLLKNKNERHIRGGNATREKYKNIKKYGLEEKSKS